MAEKNNDEGQEPIRVNTRKEFDARFEDLFGKDALSPRGVSKTSHGMGALAKWTHGMGVAAIVSWLLLWLLGGLYIVIIYAALVTCGFFGLCEWADGWLEMGDEVLDLIITAGIAFVGGMGVVLGAEQLSKMNQERWAKWLARGMEVAAGVSWLLLGLFVGLRVVILYAALVTCGFFGLCGWAEGWLEMGDSFVGFFITVIFVTAGLLGVGFGAERLLRSWRRPR